MPMSEAATHDPGTSSAHRSEALADGIFAVAMTLLVIELKLPDHASIHGSAELAAALVGLLPKAFAWLLSFFVLALFWSGHHRMFAYVRRVDRTLVGLNLLQLATVSLMPFSSALLGEHGGALVSQGVYSSNMVLLGVSAWLIARHVFRHPELGAALPQATYAAVRMRIAGLVVISVVVFVIAAVVRIPGIGNTAFLLMAVLGPFSRSLERRRLAAAAVQVK